MVSDSISFKLLDAQSAVATSKNWQEIAKDEAFSAEFGRLFEDINTRLDSTNSSENNFFGLFAGQEESAIAIVDIVLTKKSQGLMTKILNVKLSPKFWDFEQNWKEIILAYSHVISKCLLMSKQVENGYQLKLYGRSNELYSLLLGVQTELSKSASELFKQVSMQGRWLVVEHI